MRIQQINNQSFGKIILHDSGRNGECTYPARPIGVKKLYSDIYKADILLDGVIDNDYDTLELRSRYNQLIEEQKDNPFDIVIDLFLDHNPEPEDFFQRATVNGKIFKQAVIWNPKVDKVRPTTIDFLEKACAYANELKTKLHK